MTNHQHNKWEEFNKKAKEIESEPKFEDGVIEDVSELTKKASIEESFAGEKIDEFKGNAVEGEKVVELGQEELQQKLRESEKLVSQHLNEVLRIKAEADNIRRRAERDVANAHKYSLEKMAFELLVIVDNLERCLETRGKLEDVAVKNLYIGVELTLKMFLEILQKFEIKQLNPLGEGFNPEQHTAMATKEDPNVQPNVILQVMQKGYMLKDRLLRPALVVVAKT